MSFGNTSLRKVISISSCITQLFFFFFLSSTECFLLGVMAFDRFLAVCNPLSLVMMTSLTVTLMYYFYNIVTVLKIPTKIGRKVFSTCSSHLIVILVYNDQMVDFSITLNQSVVVFYTVLIHIVNPIIYCLRNKEVKVSIKRLVSFQST
ncbi:hypothetical protein XELAEV_18010429mg [Xenopus laevis]|uniref:G-protein coupled receptors family 1 profile domain-containing protein n=1 Tax=Xenopus laevis TaxID=8355 RepID=A0A974DU54_XENLA|nr:hypothetical protein XELAEV_18010429mg [Xenopus laevis]